MKVTKPYTLVAVITVTVLGALSALAPPRMLTFGWVALGPALAAASASPAAVLAVGGYALAAGFVISTWQGLLGSADQILRLLVLACITAIGWGLARHRRRLERAEAGAAQEREMLAAFTEQSTDAIIASTLDGIITAWNGGAERMYGYRADEVIGSPLNRLLPPHRAALLPEAMAQLAAGEQWRVPEIERRRKDGTIVVASVAVSPIRDERGRVVAAAATERDITEVTRARERSERAARLESLGQLAGGVAHDFNNLLAIILNYADFIAEHVTGDSAADLARIRDAADRGRLLTSQLLLFAKREPTRTEIVDLNEVVAEAGELLSRTIGADVRLECTPGAARMPVSANRGRLDQILLNLVVNARDAMPDGGVVSAYTEIMALPGDRNYAVLTVRDTGTGMTAEVRDRLFEPFFTTKAQDKGTGLGLATVYGIVTEAGGHIGVDSAPGAGTTFRVMLPLAADPPEAPAAGTECPPAQGHGERVVVLDDDDYVRDLVVRILRDNGYDTAALSEDRLAEVSLRGVALLVTDIVLREKPGPAVAEELRRRSPGLRVLYMSGYSETELRRRFDLGDGGRLVQKPFTAVELLAAVDEALEPGNRPERAVSRPASISPS